MEQHNQEIGTRCYIVWNSLNSKRKIKMNEDVPQGMKP